MMYRRIVFWCATAYAILASGAIARADGPPDPTATVAPSAPTTTAPQANAGGSTVSGNAFTFDVPVHVANVGASLPLARRPKTLAVRCAISDGSRVRFENTGTAPRLAAAVASGFSVKTGLRARIAEKTSSPITLVEGSYSGNVRVVVAAPPLDAADVHAYACALLVDGVIPDSRGGIGVLDATTLRVQQDGDVR